ncbi:MAG: hypothetical protein LUD51_04585, partial [Clostridia bacterium]|nr:hypothetical protein [Clostridia bacterium]
YAPAQQAAGQTAGYAPAQLAAGPDDTGTKANREAGVFKFLPSILLIIFSVACFLGFMMGTGYSFTFRYDSCTATFFNSLFRRDMFVTYFGLVEGNPAMFTGIVLVLVAFLSLIIGASGFGKAARSKAGQAWTKQYKGTFVWGIIMYVLAILVALAYIYMASGKPEMLADTRYYSDIIMSTGSVPVLVIVMAAICIVASICVSVIKGSATRTYGNLDQLQAAREKKSTAGHGARTGFYWTIIGKSLLFFIFAVLLFVFFRMNLFSSDLMGNESTSLYTLLFDAEYDPYGMRLAMFIIAVCAALCVIFGFISLMRDIARRKRIYTTSSQDIGSIKWSLFMMFLYCLMLAAIGYAYGKLDAGGYLAAEAEMSGYGYHIMGSLMTSIETLTIVCLIIHIILLVAQCAIHNVFSFGDDTPSRLAAPMGGYGNPSAPMYAAVPPAQNQYMTYAQTAAPAPLAQPARTAAQAQQAPAAQPARTAAQAQQAPVAQSVPPAQPVRSAGVTPVAMPASSGDSGVR